MADAAPARLEQTDAATAMPWELMAGASHDLRNPIASIRLMIDAIADDLVDDATARRYYEQIRKQLCSMTALADDVMLISQLKSRPLSRASQVFDVNNLINDALDVMAPAAGQSGVELRAEVSPSLGLIRADAEKLLRVLHNLIANAIRHSPRRGTVVVAATGRERILRLEVRDSGPGVSLEEREQVFKPFAGSQAGGSRPGHAGLGLAICRAIVERHGGRIWIGASPQGARLCVEIPACVLPREPLPARSRHLKPIRRGAAHPSGAAPTDGGC